MTVTNQLHDLAINIDGRLWVRVRDIIAATGLPQQRLHKWGQDGRCDRLVRRVGGARAVYYPLDQAVSILTRPPRGRSWRRDLPRLRAMVGKVGIPEIARRLGRTERQVKSAIHYHGLHVYDVLLHEHGLLTSGQLARLLRNRSATIHNWRRSGMPVAQASSSRRDRPLYDLQQVRAWLLTQPTRLMHLHPRVLDMLKIDLAELGDADDRIAA